MRSVVAVALTWSIATGVAVAQTPEQPTTVSVAPTYPTPLLMSILGLSITAIAVIGARVSHRSSDTMMYMVLASLAVTAVLVAYADKVHSDHLRGRMERLQQLGKPPGS